MNDVAALRISRGRAALTVMVALAASGLVVGALWSWLAPPIHGVVALARDGDRVRAYLGNEGDHFFVAAFLLVGMLCVVAVIAAVLVWQWRATADRRSWRRWPPAACWPRAWPPDWARCSCTCGTGRSTWPPRR